MTDLLGTLQEFYRDKFAELLTHERHARAASPYDINNTYQYIVNRDDTHLSWVRSAITTLGGSVADEDNQMGASDTGGLREKQDWRPLTEADAARAQAFVDRWRPRVDALTHARHRNMLRVILGEVLEQKRSFEQALSGRQDLLGRRDEAVGLRVGRVLPTRWIE